MVARILVAWLVATVLAAGQATSRDFSPAEGSKWRVIETAQLSPDGRWLAYVLGNCTLCSDGPTDGSIELVVRETHGTIERHYAGGARNSGAGALAMSASGTRIAFQTDASLAIIDLPTGFRFDLPQAKAFAFGKGDEASDWLAVASSDEITVYALSKQRPSIVARLSGAFGALSWSNDGSALAGVKTNGISVLTAIYGRTKVQAIDAALAKGETITLAPPLWRADGRGFFFNVEKTAFEEATAAHAGSPVVWHSAAPRLPTAPPPVETDLCFVSIAKGEVVRLSGGHLTPSPTASQLLAWDDRPYEHLSAQIELLPRDYYLVDLRTGDRKLFLRNYTVASLIDWLPEPSLSPDGSTIIYPEGGDYFTYDVATGHRKNLTAGLHTRFYNSSEPDIWHRYDKFAIIQGWTPDGRYVLVSDTFDVWALPLKDNTPRNLTKNGRQAQVSYARAAFLGAADGSGTATELTPGFDWSLRVAPDLRAPLYFYAIDQRTRRMGLARLDPGAGGLTRLHWDDANISFLKARSAETYLGTRETATSFPDYHTADTWTLTTRLTNANPQQSDTRWFDAPRFLTFTAAKDTLHAVLYPPVGYVAGKKYPTIVVVYEQMADAFHNYRFPYANQLVALNEVPRWTALGYAVLAPDIRARRGAPATAAVDAVTGAVRAAAATGIVDPARMAIEGHSFGGFETLALVSGTKLFKAATAMDGAADLVSDYGGVADHMQPRSARGGQYYLSGPPWQYVDEYIRNSPLMAAPHIRTPLLMIHGDLDTRVPFSNALELFSALRFLRRPVVMLQYQNEGHTLRSLAVRRDIVRRKIEFYDHVLKASPAPTWWTTGR